MPSLQFALSLPSLEKFSSDFLPEDISNLANAGCLAIWIINKLSFFLSSEFKHEISFIEIWKAQKFSSSCNLFLRLWTGRCLYVSSKQEMVLIPLCTGPIIRLEYLKGKVRWSVDKRHYCLNFDCRPRTNKMYWFGFVRLITVHVSRT